MFPFISSGFSHVLLVAVLLLSIESSLSSCSSVGMHPLVSLFSILNISLSRFALDSSAIALMYLCGVESKSPGFTGNGSALYTRHCIGTGNVQWLRLRYCWYLGNAALVRIGRKELVQLLVLPFESQTPSCHGSCFTVISYILTALDYRSIEILTVGPDDLKGLFQPKRFYDTKEMKIRRIIAEFVLEETSGGL